MSEYLPYILLGLSAACILALARFDHSRFKKTHCITGMLTGFLIGMVIGAMVNDVELVTGIGMLAGTITGTMIPKKDSSK